MKTRDSATSSDETAIQSSCRLSPMQAGMLFHTLYAPGSGVYIQQILWLLHEDLDVALFEAAWQRVSERHGILRTSFRWRDVNEPEQIVHRRVGVGLVQSDWRRLPRRRQEEHLDELLAAERGRGFDLDRAPLFRLTLLRLDEAEYRLVWSVHHIILDGGSATILLQEVLTLYEALRRGEEAQLPEPRPYRDYIAWLEAQDFSRSRDFWHRALRGVSSPTALGIGGDAHGASLSLPEGGSPGSPAEQGHHSTRLPAATTRALLALAQEHRLTLNTLVQGAWGLLLSRYSGEREVVFGATRACRRSHLEGSESMVGMFVNTLPVRLGVAPGARLVPWLAELRRYWMAMREHEHTPLVLVQEWSEMPAGASLFDTLFLFDRVSMDAYFRARGGSWSKHEIRVLGDTNYPLTLRAYGTDVEAPALELVLDYDRSRFDGSEAGRLLLHLRTLLAAMAEAPERCLADLEALSAPERHQVLIEWNDTRADYPHLRPIHELFAEQVGRTPEAIAVGRGDLEVSYGELDRRANRLAYRLRSAGVRPEESVGICLQRSVELVVALLGILKAGGHYVPLDPDSPRRRLRWMARDAGISLLLSRRGLASGVLAEGVRRIDLDAPEEGAADPPDRGPRLEVRPESLAYVMYTSGSTGKPKGVAVPHRAVVRLVRGSDFMDLGPREVFLQLAPVSFDASTLEIWGPLTNGGRLILFAPAVPSLSRVAAALRRHRISSLWLTAGLFHQMVDEELPALGGVRQLLAGGDVLSPAHVRRVVERLAPGHRLVNGYGPTENTTFTTCHPITDIRALDEPVPIGRPIRQTFVSVVDHHGQPVSAGVPGELRVGGDGLARGYHRQPARTAERFVPDRLAPHPGGRAYRTGDRVRYLADGRLEFLGRLDHQVKIRGFRVEMGEVGAALREDPAVAEAVVVARGESAGERRLVAYVKLEPHAVPEAAGAEGGRIVVELGEELRQRLPEYMLPAAFVVLDELPLGPTGKVDRRALPEPEPRQGLESTYVAPRTPAEEILAGIWADLLRPGSGSDRPEGRQPIGIEDNFFELGGHSLLATRVVSRILQRFGVEIAVRDLFEAPTVAALARHIAAARRSEGAAAESAAPPLMPRSGKLPPPLSFAQQRLWFLYRLTPENPFYNIPVALRLRGCLDTAALERALGEIVRRHEALRTTVATLDDEPVQRIRPEAPYLHPSGGNGEGTHLPLVDLSSLAPRGKEREARRLAREDPRRPFDLAAGPLLRATLLRLGDTGTPAADRASDAEHVFVLTIHHIVFDGWSMGVLRRELAALYEAFSNRRPSPLPELAIQYADFAIWQRRWLRTSPPGAAAQGSVLEAQLAWWKRQLGDDPPTLQLPTDRPRPAIQTLRGATLPIELPASLADTLRALSRSQETTLAMTLLAGFFTLLHRISGQEKILVGSPIAGRTRPEIEDLIGIFINNLPLLGDLSAPPAAAGSPRRGLTFRELLGRVRELALAAYSHQDLPFEKLVEELRLRRDLSRNPLFQAMFAFQNTPAEELELAGLTVRPLDTGFESTRFDVELHVRESPAGFSGICTFDRDLFDVTTIARLLVHYRILLEAAAASLDRPLAELSWLGAGERHQLLVEWNDTEAAAPPEPSGEHGRSIDGLFEEQARKTPDAVALLVPASPGRVLQVSYGELDRRAGRLALRLRRLGIGRAGGGGETAVGICLERSAELVVGILATLKAGGFYVPIDPAYPHERLEWLLGDSRVSVLLTCRGLLPEGLGDVPRILVEDEDREQGESEPGELKTVAGNARGADNLAYLIYTSGSTGRPKGVAVPHRGVERLVRETDFMDLSAAEVFLLLTPIVFDVSTLEIWGPLLNGGRLVVFRPGIPSLTEVGEVLERYRVSSLWLTADLFHQMVDEQLPALGGVRQLLAGGDVLSPPHVRRVLERLRAGQRMIDGYGPTENTTFTTCHSMTAAAKIGQSVPIGRPIRRTRVMVLDAHGQPLPIGVAGELATGGDGLARCYHHRAALSAERFVPDSSGRTVGGRVYRTGDLVRHLADGRIEFLGRLDHQVKVRGFRIEPGEIAAVLREHPSVEQVVVLPRPAADGTTELVAYTTPRHAAARELRAHLRQRLPDYMLPAHFVGLDDWPLTASGKLDAAALPAPEPLRTASAGGAAIPTPPRTPLEVRLAAVWESVLGRRGIGIHDDFFELGGHSLSVTRAVHRIHRLIGVEIAVRELFATPTIAELAEVVAGRQSRELEAIPRLPEAADYALSHAQRRQWILGQIDRESAVYNIPLALELDGPLDARALDRALSSLQDRHESLRTTFHAVDGEPRQVVHPAGDLRLARIDLRAVAEPAATAREIARRDAITPFDLERGPLVRAKLLELGGKHRIFLFNIHHIVSDGWSIGVLVRELMAAFASFADDRESELPPLAIHYRDYAAWHNAWLGSEPGRAGRGRAYWHRQLGGELPRLELPADRPRPPVRTFRGRTLRTELDPGLMAGLSALNRARGVSLFMLLTAAVKTLLHRYSGERDLIVGSPVAGRIHPELEDQLGFYANTLALRDEVRSEEPFTALLARVRETVLDAFEHQAYPFDRLVNELRVHRDPARSPIFDVMVALHDQELMRFDFAGVAVRSLEVESGLSRFDMTWYFYPDGGRMVAAVEYSTDLFGITRMRRMVGHLQQLLHAVAQEPERRLGELPLATAAERHALLHEANDTARPYPRQLPIHRVVARQAVRCRDRVAVEFGDARLTYGELDRRANRLAHRLRALGVGAEAPVAVLVERSVEMIVGFLAVLKAGGAYVPLDPAYPEARLRLMLEDVGAAVVLTQEHLARRLDVALTVLCLDRAAETAALPDTDPGIDVAATQVAYVMYTSGSTGQPKGVRVTHRGLVRLVTGTIYSGHGSALQIATISFDASVLEIWTALANGVRLTVFPPRLPSLAELGEFIRRRAITNVMLTPALFQPLVAERLDDLRGVHTLGTGGDVIPAAAARRAARELGGRVLNLYGPTEGAVAVTSWRVRGSSSAPIPIGRAITNTRLHVVDRCLRLVSLGVPGELVIGGDCLARDYLGRRGATAERFVPDPWAEEPGGRLYRTGDAVRAAAGGELEFLGRIDRQVKVRGVRIEPAEIESALAEHPRARQVVVRAEAAGRTGGAQRLLAYLTVTGSPPAASELRHFLEDRLPRAMVPSRFVVLERFPTTANGKIDRAALSAPAVPLPRSEALRAPGSELERRIAATWREILGIPEVSVDDNFFDLGGHSLAAIRAHARLSKVLTRELTVVKLFEYPTVASLSRYLESVDTASPTADEGRDRAAARRRAYRRRRRPRATG